MDSQTHIEFAVKLVERLGAHPALAVPSLFPQIDRRPATLHRLYAHSAFQIKRLTSFGLRYLAGGAFSDEEKQTYEYERFAQEAPRFQRYLQSVGVEGGQFGDSPEALKAAKVAYLSHLYLDTYNQPTQCFSPISVYCSGQWQLWEQLGEFRLQLYRTDTIDRLRADLFADPLWTHGVHFSPESLAHAMCLRMCRMSMGLTPESMTASALESMGLDLPSPNRSEEAYLFLVRFEEVLGGLHQKYLVSPTPRPKASTAASLAATLR